MNLSVTRDVYGGGVIADNFCFTSKLFLTPCQNREAQTVQAIVEVPTDAPSPTTPTPGAGKSVLVKSRSATQQRSGTPKLSNPFQKILRRAFSSNADQCVVMPIASPSPDSTPSEQPNAASMLESQDTLQELATNLSHPPQSIQSVYHTSHSSLSNTLVCAK